MIKNNTMILILVIVLFSAFGIGFKICEMLNTQSQAEVLCESGTRTFTTLRNGEDLFVDCSGLKQGFTGEASFPFKVSSEPITGAPYGYPLTKDMYVFFSIMGHVGIPGIKATFTDHFDCSEEEKAMIEDLISERLIFKK